MTALDLDQSAVVGDEVLVRVIDGESVLLELGSENYFGLDEVSTEFWQAITGQKTLREAVDHLHTRFDVDQAELQNDFASFVADLMAFNLVSLVPAAA